MVADKLVELSKVDIANAQTIIDLGSGTGFITDKILSVFPDKKPNKQILQLDIALQMLLAGQHQTPKIVADIESLPFERKYF